MLSVSVWLTAVFVYKRRKFCQFKSDRRFFPTRIELIIAVVKIILCTLANKAGKAFLDLKGTVSGTAAPLGERSTGGRLDEVVAAETTVAGATSAVVSSEGGRRGRR